MRALLRERGAGGRDRGGQRGDRRLARSATRPTARAAEAARAAGDRARGRVAAGAPERLRRLRPADRHGSRATSRDLLDAGARRGGARRRCGCCASGTPGAADSTCPTRTTAAPARVRGRARHGRGRLPGPARRPALSSRRSAPRAASRRASHARSAAATSTTRYRVELDDGTRAFVKTRARRRARRVRGRGGRRCAGWPSAGGAAACRRCSASATTSLVLEWVDEGRTGDEAALGRGLATIHAAGAPRLRRRRDGRVRIGAASSSPNDAAPDWPAFYAARRLRAAARTRCRRSTARAVERGDRAAAPSSPGRRRAARAPARRPVERQRALGDATAAVADRPGRLRRPPRGRPRDAAAVRLARPRVPRRLRGASTRSRAGHEERVGLWQLFPLLVHAALFGGGYAASAQGTAERYL